MTLHRPCRQRAVKSAQFRTFDSSPTTARSAHAGLNEARVIKQRSLTDGATSEAVAQFEKLVRNISEDLSVVRERVQSANDKTAREKAEARLREWSDAGLKILNPMPGAVRLPSPRPSR